MSGGLILVGKNSCGFDNVLGSGLGPWDLFRVPSISTIQKNKSTNSSENYPKFRKHTNILTLLKLNNCIPGTKNSHRLLTEKKGFVVLHFKVMMLPMAMNTVVLKHICLKENGNQNINQVNNINYQIKNTINTQIHRLMNKIRNNHTPIEIEIPKKL